MQKVSGNVSFIFSSHLLQTEDFNDLKETTKVHTNHILVGLIISLWLLNFSLSLLRTK